MSARGPAYLDNVILYKNRYTCQKKMTPSYPCLNVKLHSFMTYTVAIVL